MIAGLCWQPSDTIYYLGRSYRLKFVESQAIPVNCQAGWIRLRKTDQANADKLLHKWFEQAGYRWLDKRIKLAIRKIRSDAFLHGSKGLRKPLGFLQWHRQVVLQLEVVADANPLDRLCNHS